MINDLYRYTLDFQILHTIVKFYENETSCTGVVLGRLYDYILT